MIGIYDSGIGGLAVLENLKKIHPLFNFTYLADQELFPIGQKSNDQVIRRLEDVFDFFKQKGCTQILLACNTVSAIYLANLNHFKSETESLHIITIVDPTISLLNSNYIHLQNKSGVLIATTATINSRYYQDNLTDFSKLTYTYLRTLAWAIEEQNFSEIRNSLLNNSQLSWENIDFIVLGCTHYTWIKPIFSFLNPKMIVIDPVTETVGYIASSLEFQAQKKVKQIYLSTGKKIKLPDSPYKFKKIKL